MTSKMGKHTAARPSLGNCQARLRTATRFGKFLEELGVDLFLGAGLSGHSAIPQKQIYSGFPEIYSKTIEELFLFFPVFLLGNQPPRF